MRDGLYAPIPRQLRVRATIQLGSTRVPARSFLLAVGILVLCAVAVIGGADLGRTVQVGGVLFVVGLLVLEGRLWGRSSREVTRLLLRHLRRSRHLRLDPITITLPAETGVAQAERQPRWKT